MSGMNLYDFLPVIWFNLHTITVNSNETGTCHYKLQDNIQSAYWSNWNKHRRKISVLWTIGEHWEFTFISQLAACLYRPLQMYCRMHVLCIPFCIPFCIPECKAYMATGSFLAHIHTINEMYCCSLGTRLRPAPECDYHVHTRLNLAGVKTPLNLIYFTFI